MVLEHDAAVGLVPSTGAPPSVMLPSWGVVRPDQPQQRGLAAAAGADHGHELAGRYAQVDAGQHLQRAPSACALA